MLLAPLRQNLSIASPRRGTAYWPIALAELFSASSPGCASLFAGRLRLDRQQYDRAVICSFEFCSRRISIVPTTNKPGRSLRWRGIESEASRKGSATRERRSSL